ncbi:MAG: hypothetical protein ACLP1Y_01865 [Candidatus Acidiferrales bacterium]
MSRRRSFGFIFAVLVWPAIAAAQPRPVGAAAPPAASSPSACRVIFAGFRGVVEDPNDRHSGVVAIRKRLLSLGHPDLCARVFSPYRQGAAIKWILSRFRAGSDEAPSSAPASMDVAHGSKIILFGYSLGGWAMMAVARKLGKEHVPVELGVEVDGMWSASKTAPPNMREAANFYQRKSFLMVGRDHIRAQDPELTQIVENERLDGPGHFTIDLAPQVSDFIVAKAESFYAPE